MRVLIFHGYLLRGTGSNVYNASLGEAIVAAGHELHLFSQDREPLDLAWVDAAADETPDIGLKPGDRIVAIEGEGLLLKLLGKKVSRFSRLMVVTALSDADDVYTVTFERDVDGHKRTGRVKLGVKGISSPSRSGTSVNR